MKFQIEVIKSKIHRVTVTQADLHYVGSITIDEALLEASSRENAEAAASASTAPRPGRCRSATSSSSHPMR